ncbi:MAG: class II glutamine amidotransferase [Bdellovibrionota bacterium]
MCRLFGFRSSLISKVHTSLVAAENALMLQSPRHPDGWGVAYYIENAPHIIRSLTAAIDDHLFKKVSGLVSSQTVVAHLRKRTTGGNSVLDTHPFQYGNWVFAHNGNLSKFDQNRPEIIKLIDKNLVPFILGSTDSELIFYLIMSNLRKITALDNANIKQVATASRQAIEMLTKITGPIHTLDSGPPDQTYLTFILTNGPMLLGHQGGKTLYYSTHKKKCPDRFTCPAYTPECEKQTDSGKISHLLFSSEPTEGQNIWTPMKLNEMIGIDTNMNLCFL